MENLSISEGDQVPISTVTLPLGSYTKFQPQSVDFLDISNPKAVLENALRQFACLTLGDTIAISYNNKVYHISVVALKPGKAVSIIECDLILEFDAPIGYVEPPRVEKPAAQAAAAPFKMPALEAKPTFGDGGKSLRSKSPHKSHKPAEPVAAVVPPGALEFTFGKLTFARPSAGPATPMAVEPTPSISFLGTGKSLRQT